MEDRVERFMDVISVWQLVASLPPPGPSRIAPEEPDAERPRDWTQEICEEVIEEPDAERPRDWTQEICEEAVEEPDAERPRDWMQEFCEEVVEPLCVPNH